MIARIFLVLCLSLAANTSDSRHSIPGCGLERWKIKTLGDKFQPGKPGEATITELTKLPAPTRQELTAADSKRFEQETHTYTVKALVIGYKFEADSDYHIVLADPDDHTVTMIAELPAGKCVPPSLMSSYDSLRIAFNRAFSKPAKKFRRLSPPIPATFTGVFFFDFLHGQTGAAPNGAELHPVLEFWPAPAKKP